MKERVKVRKGTGSLHKVGKREAAQGSSQALSLEAKWVMEYQTSDIICSEKTLSETNSEEMGYKSKLRITETFISSKVTKNTNRWRG